MGWALACLLVDLGATIASLSGGAALSGWRVAHVAGVFFAAWLVMPGVPAVMGSPLTPRRLRWATGRFRPPHRGAIPFSYVLPDAVTQVQGDLEDDVEFSVYVTLPNLADDYR